MCGFECCRRAMRSVCGDGRPLMLLLLLLLWCSGGVVCFCPFRCLCNDDTLTVWCDGAALTHVPITLNPGLRELHLSGNRIKSVAASFAVYLHLRYLDVSQNLVSTLGRTNFGEQKYLLVLHVNGNRLVSLNGDAFGGLSALKVLRLDSNLLEEISADAFLPLVSLESLDLSGNRLSTLSGFYGMANLKELFLRDNKLTAVPTEALSNVPRLQSLDLGLNFLYIIPQSSFHPLSHLRTLSLDGCGIHIVEDDAFLELAAVSTLFLQDNDLGGIPTEALARIPHLKDLHLGRNRLKRLRAGDFRGLPSLRTLTVNGEEMLEVVENGTFADNVELERLVISHNKILGVLEAGALRGLDQLRFLSLRGNSFATFHEDLLPWGKLDSFDVRDNPIVCNCSLGWLWHALRSPNLTREEISRVRCEGPASVADRWLTDLDKGDLECDGDSLRRIVAVCVCVGGGVLVAAAIGFWQRHKCARHKRKLGHGAETSLYHEGQKSENFSPILSHQLVRPPFKCPVVAEL